MCSLVLIRVLSIWLGPGSLPIVALNPLFRCELWLRIGWILTTGRNHHPVRLDVIYTILWLKPCDLLMRHPDRLVDIFTREELLRRLLRSFVLLRNRRFRRVQLRQLYVCLVISSTVLVWNHRRLFNTILCCLWWVLVRMHHIAAAGFCCLRRALCFLFISGRLDQWALRLDWLLLVFAEAHNVGFLACSALISVFLKLCICCSLTHLHLLVMLLLLLVLILFDVLGLLLEQDGHLLVWGAFFGGCFGLLTLKWLWSVASKTDWRCSLLTVMKLCTGTVWCCSDLMDLLMARKFCCGWVCVLLGVVNCVWDMIFYIVFEWEFAVWSLFIVSAGWKLHNAVIVQAVLRHTTKLQ